MDRVLLLSIHDWANVGYMFQRALNSIGIEAKLMKTHKHVFSYPREGKIVNSLRDLKNYYRDSTIVHWMHSVFIKPGEKLDKRKCYVHHGGNAYRLHFAEKNKIFNPLVEKTTYQTHSVGGLGAKNEVWLIPPVDCSIIKPNFKRMHMNDLVFAHYPSSMYNKGTENINRIVREAKDDGMRFTYKFSTKREKWRDNIGRIARCDVYIEQMMYGGWGVTAMEAAATGKIVITTFRNVDKYEKEYGECGLLVANTDRELKERIKQVLSMNDKELLEMKQKSRAWVETIHSFENIGKKMKNEVYEI